MVTLGTARIVNITNFEREFFATTVIPCPDIAIWSQAQIDTGSPPVTVQGANIAPGDVRCQSYIQGPKWPSGRPKYLRVTFRGEIAAGVINSNYFLYPYYMEKVVTFTSDVTAGVAFNLHSAVASAIGNTSITVRIPYTAGYKTIDLSLLPVIALQTGLEYEQEIGNQANQVMRSFIGGARTSVSNSEPSFYADILFEVYSNSRIVRWWIVIGNANYTSTPSQQYDNTDWTMPGTSDLEIVFNNLTVTTIGADTHLNKNISVVGSVTTIPVISSTTPNSIPQDRNFVNGQQRIIEGIFTFESGASAPQIATMNAEKIAYINDFIVSQNWGDYNSYGPMQALPAIPTNAIVQGDPVLGRRKAHEQFANEWANLSVQSKKNWSTPQFYSSPSEAGLAAGQNPHGVCKGFIHARSGQPDFRTLRLEVYKEGYRPQHFRESFPSVYPVYPSSKTGLSGNWSDLYFWHSMPFFGNQVYPANVSPTFANSLGKRGANPPQNPPRNNNNQANRWTPYDDEHFTIDWLGVFAHLTGNRIARRLLESYETSLLSMAWPVIDSRESNAITITATRIARAEGRMFQSLIWCYLTTGNPLIITNLLSRVENVFQNPSYGWVGQFSNFEVKTMGIGFNLPGDDLLGPQNGWRPWMNALCSYGLYALYLHTKHLGTPATILLDDMIRKLTYSIMVYGTRNNIDSGNLRRSSKVLSWQPYGLAGQYVRDADKFNNSIITTGSAAGLPFAVWDSIYDIWELSSAILGYEFALQTNDVAYQTVCYQFIRDFDFTAGLTGLYGWGNNYVNNIYEWIGIIPNPLKSRSPGGGSIVFASPVNILGVGSVTLNNSKIVATPVFGTSTINGAATVSATGSISGTSILNGFCNINASAFIIASGSAVGGGGNIPGTSTILGVGILSAEGVVTDPSQAPTQVTNISGDIKISTELVVRAEGGKVTKVNQIVQVWSADTAVLDIFITDSTGLGVDLSSVTDVIWKVANDVGATPLITKSYLTGGVFILPQVTNKGKIRILLNSADTNLLNGKFYHECKVIQGQVVVTAFIGFMLVQPSLIKSA